MFFYLLIFFIYLNNTNICIYIHYLLLVHMLPVVSGGFQGHQEVTSIYLIRINPGQANGSKLSPLTHKFANLGTAGKHPSNIERDLSSLLRLPVTPIWVEIPVRSAVDRSTLEVMKVPVLLPHEVYHYLYVP